MPLYAEGKIDTFVGRIRKDPDTPNGFHLWIVSDNLLKGAAWNSVQIAETMVERESFSMKETRELLKITVS
ncbi:Asd/ArgC dimerization domain-containing protein [Bacillus paranthracis]